MHATQSISSYLYNTLILKSKYKSQCHIIIMMHRTLIVERRMSWSALLSNLVFLVLVTYPIVSTTITTQSQKAHAVEIISNPSLRTSESTIRREQQRHLIVGGNEANVLHYPKSIVYLSDRMDGLSCGGTLISPTIVLAAGHCEISLVHDAVFQRFGEFQQEDGGEPQPQQRERRIPVRTEIQHPQYDPTTLQYDVMLLVLERSPNDEDDDTQDPTHDHTIPYMKLHEPTDPSMDELVDMMYAANEKKRRRRRKIQTHLRAEATEADTEEPAAAAWSSSSSSVLLSPKQTPLQFKALGWGHTTRPHEDIHSQSSDILREANLNYVTNQDCDRQRESFSLSYEGRISDDMMCTWHSQQDTCHGDSGGPLVLENPKYAGTNLDTKQDIDDREKFIQVGIVSWGEDCADEIFPGVASRVSSSYEWIRERVCSIDGARDDTPLSFNCAPDSTFSPAPSPSPQQQLNAIQERFDRGGSNFFESKTTVDVTIEIYLDVYAKEQAWDLIENEEGETIKVVPFGTYQHENFVQEMVQLKVGRAYNFTIYDTYGDGITNEGYYRIYSTTVNNNGIETETELVGETPFSGFEQRNVFTVVDTTPPGSSVRVPLPTSPRLTPKREHGFFHTGAHLPVDMIP